MSNREEFRRLDDKLDRLFWGQLMHGYKLDRVVRFQETLIRMEIHTMALIDDVITSVTEETTEVQSAITLLEGLSAALAAAGTDPVKLTALKTSIDSNKAALAAAVLANTPSAPPAA